ncbi:uncharacterized protein LOC126746843 [Anthonomus grandis grandis]|uniref:uncharacterized protein LOC126746843 n=1 Tax=Anthonomus grandis grandis TaxID=2921223 RepID=UPI00216581B5|nr:uncharacterized protein LOC126746843 [Anthonomus grandis grandis]
MDVEILIASVYKKCPIWDKKSKLHSNRNVVDKCWKEIAEEMKEDENKLRKKWKYIRDQFSVELGKFPPPRSGDAANDTPTSKWPYFKLLLFLKDTVMPRKLKGNLPQVSGRTESFAESQTEAEESIQSSMELDETSFCSTEDVVPPQRNAGDDIVENTRQENIKTPSRTKRNTDVSSTPQFSSKKKRGPTEIFNDSLLEIEKQKVAYLESKSKRANEKEDEHLLFFKSLLPHVKKIPESRVLAFRCRVQELVEQFSYPLNRFESVPSTILGPSTSNSSISNQSLNYIDRNRFTAEEECTSLILSNMEQPETVSGTSECPPPLSFFLK